MSNRNFRLTDPHHWTDIEGGAEWSKQVRVLFEKMGFKVKHSEYPESFFYTKDGELRGCGWHRFHDCGCDEVTLDELKEIQRGTSD